MDVALDLEEVLADTISESCRSTDSLAHSDFDTWNLDSQTWQIYSGVSDALWRHDPLSIQPVEPGISEYTEELYYHSDNLDIVTARVGVDKSVEYWLAEHNIYYDELVATNRPKYTLDYDVYIDDNPTMHGNCRLLLRHHRHNTSVEAAYSKMTDRIHSLVEATEFIR